MSEFGQCMMAQTERRRREAERDAASAHLELAWIRERLANIDTVLARPAEYGIEEREHGN